MILEKLMPAMMFDIISLHVMRTTKNEPTLKFILSTAVCYQS